MNPHFYAELSRVSNEELDRVARSHRDRSPARVSAAKSNGTPTRRSRLLAVARLRPVTR